MCTIPSPCSNSIQLLQYSKLQMAKTVDKTYFVQVYNTYIPHEPATSKHEYTTSAGKFVNRYTQQKSIVSMSTICGHIWQFLFVSKLMCSTIYCIVENFWGRKLLQIAHFYCQQMQRKLSRIGTKIKRTNKLCCHILRSCHVVLVKRLHF